MFCYAATGNRAAALKQYDDCKRVLQDELGVEPSSETTTLYEKIRAEETGGKAQEALLSNLPIPLTSFVGRQAEIVYVKRLVETTQLLTLTGAGGCGKTRLAIQVATELAAVDRFKHGVWWVDLAPLNDSALVTQSVAMVFGLSESPGTSLMAVLTDYLRAKELLLVIDNCEHLLGACTQLIGTLLSACPKLKIVATSREVLNISGEVAWRVPSLALPDVHAEHLPPLDKLRQYDAIQLFAERATAVAANWRLVENAAPAAQVCVRLDGIPLAIELAAARLKVLSAQEIAARLDDRFNLLTGGSRIAIPRHQTLRAAMDWSYDLLSDAERALLRRLSVFAGGFSLEAVEAVCSELGRTTSASTVNSQQSTDYRSLVTVHCSLLDLLTSLIDKSLIIVETRGNATRYKLLETVRQHAREKLLEANESETYLRRHRDWFLEFAEQTDPKLHGRDQVEWCERLERETENFRAALAWSLKQTDGDSTDLTMRLAGSLWWFWLLRGYWDEARTWLERTLATLAITPARAKAVIGLGLMEYFAGTPVKARPLYGEALTMYRQQGDKWGIAFAASLFASREGDPAKARALFEEARSIARESNDEWLAARIDIGHGQYAARQRDPSLAYSLYASALEHARRSGDRWLIGNALRFWGVVALDQGDDDRAAILFTESLAVRRELGNKNAMANDLYALGKVAWRRHDSPQAEAFFKQALVLRREMGNTRGIVECLWGLGRLAAAEQQYERAARLLGSINMLCEMLDVKDGRAHEVLDARDRRAYEEGVRAACAELDATTSAAALATGRGLSLEQAIEYALENVENT